MNSTRRYFSLLLLVAVPALLSAEPPRKITSVEGLTEYQLDNGLRVLLFPDHSQAKVSVNMTVLVGSRHEGYGETGMAHLLEHMVFKGTPRHPNVPKVLQDQGAQFNGRTSADRVNYFETLVANDADLEFAIDLEADRLVNSLIKREDLESEMTVVRNEFERGENSPLSVLNKRISAAAYEWHNYGKTTIGNRSDIERVPVENLRAFYRKFYQPDNVVLIVAGKFDEARALGFVVKHFGAIPRPTRKLDNLWTEEPPQDGERAVTLRRVGDVSAVGVAYHIPSGSHEDTAALQILANILTTPPSGRLFKALVETKKAASAGAFAGREHDPGLLTLQAEVARDNSLEEVRDLLLSTAEQIGAQGVTAEEVNRAQQQILKARAQAATDTAQLGIALSEWAADRDQEAFRHEYQDRSVVQMAGRNSLDQYYSKPLSILNSIVEKLITECASLQSVTDRCEYRLNLYASIFADVLSCVKFWPADRNDPFLLSTDFREDMEKEDKDQEAAKATLLSFADEIENNLKGKQVDFTDRVKSIVANFGEVARVEGNDIVMPSKSAIDNSLLYKLKTVLQSIAQRSISYSRGLDSGKIDRTRLFRAPTTGSIFSLKKSKYELYNDIVLLVDCTGSMAEPVKWSKVTVIYQTLFMAIASYNPNARIFAYNERKDTCRITEIYKQGKFYSVIPHGRTASGEAIIATALSLKPGRRKPFIIHITDGASNWGCGVHDAITYCKNKKILLLTLGLECDPMNKTALSKEHGELIQFVNSVDNLPTMLKNLLISSKYS